MCVCQYVVTQVSIHSKYIVKTGERFDYYCCIST